MTGIDLVANLIPPVKPLGADLEAVRAKLSSQTLDKDRAKAAKDFEAILIYKLLEEVKRTIPESGLLGGGAQTSQMQDIFWHHLSQELADQGGFGMWKQIYDQIGTDHQAQADPVSVGIVR